MFKINLNTFKFNKNCTNNHENIGNYNRASVNACCSYKKYDSIRIIKMLINCIFSHFFHK